MARRLITPSLADVTQDIAGAIPIDLIKKWTGKKKDGSLHTEILNEFVVEGTVVSSDSSGLSKLSKSMELIELMKLVSFPKDIIFEEGTKIGGTPIGIWAADNTEMFYPKSVSADTILKSMQKVQERLKDYQLKIGMAIHYGEFMQIGGGLFNKNADMVEELAENKAEGGEILMTKDFKNKLNI